MAQEIVTKDGVRVTVPAVWGFPKGSLIRILPPVGGWQHTYATHWSLPPQAKPNAQGNYVASPGPNPALKKALASVPVVLPPANLPVTKTPLTAYRLPQPGDRIKHRDTGSEAIITDIVYPCPDPASSEFEEVGEPRMRVLLCNAPGSHLIEDYVWGSVEVFFKNIEVTGAGFAYTPQLLRKAAAVDMSKYPHTCKVCGSPSYNGFTNVECSNGSCSANRGFVK